MSKVKIPPELLKDPRHFLSLGFGSGLMPKAPGTFGTLAAVPVYCLMAMFLPVWWYVAVCAVVIALGVYLCEFTSRALATQDHPGIVWDEFAGLFITMLFVPFEPITLVLGFMFFRIFDILKPWPISVIDSRIKGGLGVMLDDVLAGLYALGCMHVFVWLYY